MTDHTALLADLEQVQVRTRWANDSIGDLDRAIRAYNLLARNLGMTALAEITIVVPELLP